MKARATERLKLVVAYEGTPFRGWQSQVGGNTVQDRLASAFQKLMGRKITVHGAGRTDAGVHALAQCAHVEVEHGRLATGKWVLALNAHLPPEIRVLRCRRVSHRFHARYSARGKIYTYRIWNDRVLSPFEIRRSWQVPLPVDLDRMRAAAALLVGRHDFAGFAANRGEPKEDTTRTVRRIDIRRRGSLLTLTFEGDGFLYKMVRLMTGTLVRVGLKKEDPAYVARLLESAGVEMASHCAPAEGLYLTRVLY